MVNGKQKGTRAEREVAQFIQTWWGSFESGCRFVRTPQSGGWGGPELRAEFQASGDLMTTAKKFPFCIEVKRRERWSMRELRAGRLCPVWEWWRQCQTAALEMGKIPMLWFRKSHEPWRIMMPIGCLLNAEFSWYKDEIKADYGRLVPAVWQDFQILRSDPARIYSIVWGSDRILTTQYARV